VAVHAQENAALLIAHCSTDVSHDVIRLLTEARVPVTTFAPHTTQVIQVLDLGLFGVLKWCPRYELPFDENNATVKVGFESDTRREPYELFFDEVKLSGRRHIVWLSRINRPE
jgi:hypothetical protein